MIMKLKAFSTVALSDQSNIDINYFFYHSDIVHSEIDISPDADFPKRTTWIVGQLEYVLKKSNEYVKNVKGGRSMLRLFFFQRQSVMIKL